jgi:transcriptional regulator with XRE-family HTH domain
MEELESRLRARNTLPPHAARRAIRMAAGASLADVAAAVGVTRARVYQWEHGANPSGANVARYGEVLRMLQEVAA